MAFETMLSQLLGGLLVTMELFAITLVGALPLGMLVALLRLSKNGVIRNIMRVYISIMRGTPLMLQIFVVYFGPFYMFGISITNEYRFVAAAIAFILNYAAYFAEIYRAGIESIPRGQNEAASVLGYSRAQTFLHITLPQVIKRVLPPITNEMITLTKDTVLAFSISVMEMFTIAKAIASAERSMAPFVAAGVFYYVLNLLIAFLMERVEKKLNYYR